jgi:hypothetical protein
VNPSAEFSWAAEFAQSPPGGATARQSPRSHATWTCVTAKCSTPGTPDTTSTVASAGVNPPTENATTRTPCGPDTDSGAPESHALWFDASSAAVNWPVTWPVIVGRNTCGPNCHDVRAVMFTAAISAPVAVSAYPDASPPAVSRGPACAETGSTAPW